MCWPPILGQGSLQWPAVFSAIHQLALLWDCWKPSKTLNQMTIQEVWECYNDGEPVFDVNGNQTGIKLPLQLVEQHWKAEWWGGPMVELIIVFSILSRAKHLLHASHRTIKPGGG
jgi:hypothetical protein